MSDHKVDASLHVLESHTAGLVIDNDIAWEQHHALIDGREFRIFIREHAPPISLRQQLQLVSRSELTAIGLWALSIDHARHIANRRDFVLASQYFEDQQAIMGFYEDAQIQLGGWGEFAERIRAATESEIETIQIAGEAIHADYYIYVLIRPNADATFRVLRRLSDGRYRHVNEWGPDVGPLLRENRLLKPFTNLESLDW